MTEGQTGQIQYSPRGYKKKPFLSAVHEKKTPFLSAEHELFFFLKGTHGLFGEGGARAPEAPPWVRH